MRHRGSRRQPRQAEERLAFGRPPRDAIAVVTLGSCGGDVRRAKGSGNRDTGDGRGEMGLGTSLDELPASEPALTLREASPARPSGPL
jgi:hypothetical protein